MIDLEAFTRHPYNISMIDCVVLYILVAPTLTVAANFKVKNTPSAGKPVKESLDACDTTPTSKLFLPSFHLLCGRQDWTLRDVWRSVHVLIALHVLS